MRRLLLMLIAVGVLIVPLGAQTNLVTFENVTIDNTAAGIGFTSTTITPAGAPIMTKCSGKLETAQIRYRFDGTAPTTTVGAVADIGDTVTITGYAYLQAFRAIRTGSSSGYTTVVYNVDGLIRQIA
jgi:hypothetical protein